MNPLGGLTALVTGGASGLGAAIAARLLSDGVRVAVLDRDVSNASGSVIALTADVVDDESVSAAVSEAIDRLGGLDILVNNAGIGAQGGIEDNLDDEWRRIFDVNVIGIARVTRAALPALRRSNAASIVNTASVVASVGLQQRALYSASKGAVVALTKAMAADLLEDGIRVNCVSPGTADTPWVGRLLAESESPQDARAALENRQPHGRLVSADEVADAVAYLASPRAGSTNGVDLAVDGGLSSLRTPPRVR